MLLLLFFFSVLCVEYQSLNSVHRPIIANLSGDRLARSQFQGAQEPLSDHYDYDDVHVIQPADEHTSKMGKTDGWEKDLRNIEIRILYLIMIQQVPAQREPNARKDWPIWWSKMKQYGSAVSETDYGDHTSNRFIDDLQHLTLLEGVVSKSVPNAIRAKLEEMFLSLVNACTRLRGFRGQSKVPHKTPR